MKLKMTSRAFLNGSAFEVVVEFGLDYPRAGNYMKITILFKCKNVTV